MGGWGRRARWGRLRERPAAARCGLSAAARCGLSAARVRER